MDGRMESSSHSIALTTVDEDQSDESNDSYVNDGDVDEDCNDGGGCDVDEGPS